MMKSINIIEIKDLSKWRDTMFTELKTQYYIKVSIFPESTYRFTEISVKSQKVFVEIDKLDLCIGIQRGENQSIQSCRRKTKWKDLYYQTLKLNLKLQPLRKYNRHTGIQIGQWDRIKPRNRFTHVHWD